MTMRLSRPRRSAVAVVFPLLALMVVSLSGAAPGATAPAAVGTRVAADPSLQPASPGAHLSAVAPAGGLVEPTGRLRVSGSGFPASTSVSVVIDSTPRNPRVRMTTDTAGRFAAVVHVPARTLPGPHVVTASTGRLPGGGFVRARTTIQVHTNWPVAYGDPGATNSSATENLLSPATASGLKVAWGLPLPYGRSSVVVDGVAYVVELNDSRPDGIESGSIQAVDAATGTVLWRYTTYGRAAPLVIGDEVWQYADNGGIIILDKATGAFKDVVDFADTASTCVGCLIELDGTVYALGQHETAAVNETTHEVRYGAAPIVANKYGAAFANGRVFSGGTALSGFDLATGKQVWKVSPPVAGQGTTGAAIAANGLVYASWTEDGIGEVAAYRQSDGKLVWQSAPDVGGGFMTVLDGTVYVQVSNGNDAPLNALDGATGARLWSSDTPVNTNYPIFSGGGLVLVTSQASGTTRLGLIDAATGALAASYDDSLAPQPFWGNVAIADGRFYYKANNGNYMALGIG